MPLNIGAPIGSEAYRIAASENAYGRSTTTTSNSIANGPSILRYPLKALDSTSDYLEIKIFDYVHGTFDLGPPVQTPTVQQRLGSKTAAKHYIQLPIPQSINDINSLSWGEDTLNPLQAGLISYGADFINEPVKATKKAIEAVKKAYENITQEQQEALKYYITAQATNILPTNVGAESLISRATGQVLQSNLELLFQGVNLRTFPFTFQFAPRSKKEAQIVKQIIRVFKQTMSAKSGGAGIGQNTNSGLFINSPSIYQLTYRSGGQKHPFLNTFKPCALTDITMNYTGSGTYSTYTDGTPVHMEMALVFKEINPVYAEDYDEPEALDGVGY